MFVMNVDGVELKKTVVSLTNLSDHNVAGSLGEQFFRRSSVFSCNSSASCSDS